MPQPTRGTIRPCVPSGARATGIYSEGGKAGGRAGGQRVCGGEGERVDTSIRALLVSLRVQEATMSASVLAPGEALTFLVIGDGSSPRFASSFCASAQLLFA